MHGETPETPKITLEATETGVLGYVYLRDIAEGEVAETVDVEPDTIFADYNAEGMLLGVEFLAAEEADERTMRQLAEKLNAPALAGIDLAKICRDSAG